MEFMYGTKMHAKVRVNDWEYTIIKIGGVREPNDWEFIIIKIDRGIEPNGSKF